MERRGAAGLHKSPDNERDEAWERRKVLRRGRQCVTDDDIQELRGCIDLGFGFHNRLVQMLPALDLYYATAGSGYASSEPPTSIFSPGDPQEKVKMRLKQWAQVVALSLRNRS